MVINHQKNKELMKKRNEELEIYIAKLIETKLIYQ